VSDLMNVVCGLRSDDMQYPLAEKLGIPMKLCDAWRSLTGLVVAR